MIHAGVADAVPNSVSLLAAGISLGCSCLLLAEDTDWVGQGHRALSSQVRWCPFWDLALSLGLPVACLSP